MKITFPHMGNTYIAGKVLLDELGVDYVIPPFNSQRDINSGIKYAPEMACLPLKINIGNYIQAIEKGADTILIVGGCGPCRFGYYGEMHKAILKDMGYEVEVITLELPDGDLKEFIRRIKKVSNGARPLKVLKAVSSAVKIAKQVDELERLTFKLRPREQLKGEKGHVKSEVDRMYKSFQQKVLDMKGVKQAAALIRDTWAGLLSIPLYKGLKPLKIGIVGEIYTTIDSFTNFNIEQKLGNMGIEVDRSLNVSGWIIEHIVKHVLRLKQDLRYREAARPYLGAMIGGHAQETLGNSVLYARAGYDGLIQIYPLTCMPEIVAESLLPAVQRDFDIPVLTLIIDEMTGEAGYLTRLEAFIDLLEKRRESAGKSENMWVLSGN